MAEFVFTVTLLFVPGTKVEEPLALNVCPLGTSAPPFALRRPVTLRLLLTVVLPDPAPRERVDAAPPILRVVTPELRRLNVEEEEVRFPPLTARFPPAVTSPVRVEVPFTVRLPLVDILPVDVIVVPVDE